MDFKNRRITIEKTVIWDQENWEAKIKLRPKNGRVRVLSLPSLLAEELSEAYQMKECAFVFHQDGELLIRKSIGDAYNRALKACGITHVSGTHFLRRTSATQANRVTGDFYAVSRNLGHSNVEETQRYVEEVDESKVKVASALDGVARAAIGQSVQNSAPKWCGKRRLELVPPCPPARKLDSET